MRCEASLGEVKGSEEVAWEVIQADDLCLPHSRHDTQALVSVEGVVKGWGVGSWC